MEAIRPREVFISRSFVGPAILSAALYWLGFYVVGLVVNLIYIGEARKLALQTGHAQSGSGCLWTILVVHLGLLLASCGIGGLLLVAGLTAS